MAEKETKKTPAASAASDRDKNLNVALAGNNLEAVASGDIREIRLFDVNNRETLRWNGNARRVSLDISALKPGVYAIRAVSGKKTLTRLVVKR